MYDYGEFDWSGALDTEERVEATPTDVGVKGMFFRQVIDHVRAETGVVLTAERFIGFRDYPLREWVALQARASSEYPNLAPHEAIRHLGLPTFSNFRRSLIGRIIFGHVDFERALEVCSNAYRRTSDLATCELSERSAGTAVMQLRNVYDFPSWSIGLFEGGMKAFDLTGTVRVRVLSICDLDLKLGWSNDNAKL